MAPNVITFFQFISKHRTDYCLDAIFVPQAMGYHPAYANGPEIMHGMVRAQQWPPQSSRSSMEPEHGFIGGPSGYYNVMSAGGSNQQFCVS